MTEKEFRKSTEKEYVIKDKLSIPFLVGGKFIPKGTRIEIAGFFKKELAFVKVRFVKGGSENPCYGVKIKELLKII